MRDTPPDQRFALSQRVVLREFSSRGDAEVVRELLLANGIEAFVISGVGGDQLIRTGRRGPC